MNSSQNPSFTPEPVGASTLRFLTCGSVDDGKSTLIGRLLYDTRVIPEDQLSTLARDSKRHGTTGNDIDLALLVDGLEAEREQGITIDVAYRFFATPKRKFIVADTPGHEQYTRNMATGASNSDLAVILVDARKGVLPQSRRHAHIVSRLGINHVILAVNKMDLVDYSQSCFEAIVQEFSAYAKDFRFAQLDAVPLSARDGDNVTRPSQNMPWYSGPTLLTRLEAANIVSGLAAGSFRMPVQYVIRPDADFRGFAGTVISGNIAAGDLVTILPSGRKTRVNRIVTYDGDQPQAIAGQAITLVLQDDIDVSRGDVICDAQDRLEVADQFAAYLLWMADEELLPHRQYILKLGTKTVSAEVTSLKHRRDVNTLEKLAAHTLHLNEIGYCNISTSAPLAFEAYAKNRDMGAFILIDKLSNATVGAGMIEFPLRRATNVHWHALDVNAVARAAQKQQSPCVLWFTGLSGSGKSTIANAAERLLYSQNRHSYLLDGDNIRHGLNRDLGFTDADRVENIRRVSEVAKILVDAGLIVLVSLISPFRSERQLARSLFLPGQFIEVFVDTPLELCMARDPKGLYKRALAGEIPNFTGINSPYEMPENPELILKTETSEPDQLAEKVVSYIQRIQGSIQGA